MNLSIIQHLATGVTWLSDQIRPHTLPIATAIAATLLTIYGESMNRFVRDRIRSHPFVLRVTLYIAICAFGYGALTLAAAALLARILAATGGLFLAPAVLLIFVVIGLLAERRRQI